MNEYDLVIRAGTIADGSGGELFSGDLAVKDGRIAAVGSVRADCDAGLYRYPHPL
jgi:N-acyl-D-amino-acid deacylase